MRDTAQTSDPVSMTVFVVDDDEDIRSSLSRALRKRGYEVETFASAKAFLAGYDGTGAGCLILDHGMPEITGLELQKQLIALNYPIPIIFITGHGGVPESVQAIKNGAVDFLEKPFRQSVLIERIETAFGMAAQIWQDRAGDQRTQALFERLTLREQEIVTRILEHPSATSSKEIGNFLGISPRTVDHHRARILEKLQVKGVAELVALAKEARR